MVRFGMKVCSLDRTTMYKSFGVQYPSVIKHGWLKLPYKWRFSSLGNHRTKLGIEKIPTCPDVTVMSLRSFQVVPAGFCGRFAQLMPSGHVHFCDSNIEASTNGSQTQQEDRSECGGRPRHTVNCLPMNAMAPWMLPGRNSTACLFPQVLRART